MNLPHGPLQRLSLPRFWAIPLLLVLLSLPASAHHPLGMAEGTPLSPVYGLVSGLGHPLLGIDHALFLISIAFVGLTSLRLWLIPLLAVGLAGSAFAQVLHTPVLPGGIEVVVALSLVVSGLGALRVAPLPLLFPMMFLHGLVLGSQIVGSEPTPIALYFLGLLISQSLLLLVSCWLGRVIQAKVTSQARTVAGFAWIGIGIALAWSAATSG